MYRIIVTVKEVKGHCGIHNEGDRFVVDEGQVLSLDTAKSLCVYALAGLIPLFPALSKDLPADDWMSAETQYIQCIDPGPEYGGGGTVLFEIKRERVT
ncbi:MAG: TIGR04076 family protein [Candidatus Lokiarchaeia archaeon]